MLGIKVTHDEKTTCTTRTTDSSALKTTVPQDASESSSDCVHRCPHLSVQLRGMQIQTPFIDLIDLIVSQDSPAVSRTPVSVLYVPSNPFVRYVDDAADKRAPADKAVEGFCVDLLEEITTVIALNKSRIYDFQMRRSDDNKYGIKVDGVWKGMIGQVSEGKADMAIGDITITGERETVVDFTTPFMKFGISAIAKTTQSPSIFFFLSPLPIQTWGYIVGSILLVSLVLTLLSRSLSRDKDNSPNSCNLCDTFYHVLASILMRNTNANGPDSASIRILRITWWFFIVVLASTYIASLTVYLNSEVTSKPVKHIDQLASLTKVPYGMVRSGSTEGFFRNGSTPQVKQMWYRIESTYPSAFVSSTKEGLERVKKGNYIFLMESNAIEYAVDRNCDLYQVEGLFNWKGYGIVVNKQKPELLSDLNMAIAEIQKNGALAKLKARWWLEKDDGNKCSRSQPLHYQLHASAFDGLYRILLTGILLSLVVAAVEYISSKRRQP